MTPKEKAKELILKFAFKGAQHEGEAKTFALIAVDESIESIKQLIHNYTKGNNERYADIYLSMSLSVTYWQQVKQEIQKI